MTLFLNFHVTFEWSFIVFDLFDVWYVTLIAAKNSECVRFCIIPLVILLAERRSKNA